MTDNDTKAFFGDGVGQHMDSLYSVALRMTRRDADAEDLVAETVAKAWSSIATLSDRASFRPWLFRILHNTFVSEYRKKSIRPTETSIDSGENSDNDLASLLNDQPDEFLNWWSTPEQEYFNDLLGDQLLRAIDALPDNFRSVVVLVNVEGFTYDETAVVLGIPPGTVRSRMKRGRTLLQKELWEQRPASYGGTKYDT